MHNGEPFDISKVKIRRPSMSTFHEEASASFKWVSHFESASEEVHEQGTRGEDVADYCKNCFLPFMAHTNGKCPDR